MQEEIVVFSKTLDITLTGRFSVGEQEHGSFRVSAGCIRSVHQLSELIGQVYFPLCCPRNTFFVQSHELKINSRKLNVFVF